MYGILWVEARYLSHFFILFWAAALMLVRLPDTTQSRCVLRVVFVVTVALMSCRLIFHLTNDAVQGRRAAKTQCKLPKVC